MPSRARVISLRLVVNNALYIDIQVMSIASDGLSWASLSRAVDFGSYVRLYNMESIYGMTASRGSERGFFSQFFYATDIV